jgi:hypothetical protein
MKVSQFSLNTIHRQISWEDKMLRKKWLKVILLASIILFLSVSIPLIAKSSSDGTDQFLSPEIIPGIAWSDDFEPYVVGNWPGPYTCHVCNGLVTNTMASQAIKSFQLNGTYGGCWESDASRLLQVNLPFEVELMAATGAFSGCHDRGLTIRPTIANPWFEGLYDIYFASDGHIRASGGQDLGSYMLNTFYKVKMRMEHTDPGFVKVTYWINDVEKFNEVRDDPRNYINLSFLSGDGLSWIDEIQVTQLPEQEKTIRISVDSGENQANNNSFRSVISGNGEKVAFYSDANNLVATDGNIFRDVFLRDVEAGTTELVSVGVGGTPGNGDSGNLANNPGLSISADGNWIGYESGASNLVDDDTNEKWDVFCRDMDTPASNSFRLSLNIEEQEGNYESLGVSISDQCEYSVFHSPSNNFINNDPGVTWDVFVRDLKWGELSVAARSSDGIKASNTSWYPEISSDGRFITYSSLASNLTPGDNNSKFDIFLFDRFTQQTKRISEGPVHIQADGDSTFPSISADGRYIAYSSDATNLVGGDDNNKRDVFVYDRILDQTNRVSLAWDNSQALDHSEKADISGDGRFITFSSAASNLVADDTNGFVDVFVRDRLLGSTIRVSVDSTGSEANSYSDLPSISADGRYITFYSAADNLVLGDTNHMVDIFRYDQGDVGMDLSIDSLEPVQVIDGQDLVKGKSTVFKAVVHKTGSLSAHNLTISLDFNGTNYTDFYLSDPSNLDGFHRFVSSTNTVDFSNTDYMKIVYFYDGNFTPSASTLPGSTVTVMLPLPYTEINYANNSLSIPPTAVFETIWSDPYYPDMDLLFFKIDWSSDPLFATFVEKSSEFLAGVFPIADDQLKVAKSPLSYSTFYDRNPHWKLSIQNLVNWTKEKLVGLTLAQPQTDKFVGVFPPNWFSNNLDSSLDLPGVFYGGNLVLVEANPTVLPNDSSVAILPHELTHTYGLVLEYEEYDCDHSSTRDADCNGNLASPGIWVNQGIPMDDPNNRDTFCYMSASDLPEYWIGESEYSTLLNSHKATFTILGPSAPPKTILVIGSKYRSGTAEFDDWYILDESEPSDITPGTDVFEYLNDVGTIIGHVDAFIPLVTEHIFTLTDAPFVLKIPYISGTDRVRLKSEGIVLAEKSISDNAPLVDLITPNGGEKLNGTVTIYWDSFDADGDLLSFSIFYSSDSGLNWYPVTIGFSENSYTWNTAFLPVGTNYRIKIIATDGFNSTEDESINDFSLDTALFVPIISK